MKQTTLNVVVTTGLKKDIDALTEERKADSPHAKLTRSDVVREIIIDGLRTLGYPRSSKPAASRKAK
jgi:hypothetical protein